MLGQGKNEHKFFSSLYLPATSAELSVPTSKSCHLCYGSILDLIFMFSFLNCFWQSADEKFWYSEGQGKKLTTFVLVYFYSTHAWQKTNKQINQFHTAESFLQSYSFSHVVRKLLVFYGNPILLLTHKSPPQDYFSCVMYILIGWKFTCLWL